ncbi:uncharacterized protein FOMMEDRAFT_162568 [Fomitiporia mediterranea MF3/22]|uniref:Uncharacterized protein n=1 Tax=Fomitiporia mediterranea (strain MF3/22) TaxID=694068 RepID=R7SHL9_FOMME|nr:uncharacterized protein FOMMEDRAFT_162568 [Fomitiporia mediterranea MF3/22]EJC97757.1 hypothetical protein FOMMEDRAFT_162568 [Fomitiporia mediterranea MF3/22]
MVYTFCIRPYRIRIGFRVQKYGTVLYEPYPYKGRIIRPVSVYVPDTFWPDRWLQPNTIKRIAHSGRRRILADPQL